MRIVMMGTGPFAVPTFQSLLTSPDHEVPALITRPPRGSGKKGPPPNPMQQVAEAAGLRVEMPDSIKSPEANALLDEFAADLFVVCDYGQILSNENLTKARLGGINLHASLLPKYRGAAPINWAIYDGCTESGVTVIHMTPKLDGGPMLVQTVIPIEPAETTEQLEPRMAEIGVASVNEAIATLTTWNGESSIGEIQDKAAATKAPRLKKSDGNIDWTRTAEQIVNQFRAFQPWPGTFTHWLPAEDKGKSLRVVLAEITATSCERANPGTVLPSESGLLIATSDGAIQVHEIQPAGKKRMAIDAFLRGYRVQPEDSFGTPSVG